MFSVREVFANFEVALRKESVDRNWGDASESRRTLVALRKESVDRNLYLSSFALASLVALRKESVDRNHIRHTTSTRPSSRSPQGERG